MLIVSRSHIISKLLSSQSVLILPYLPNLSSTAFVTTGNDLAQVFLGIPLAYAAGRGHRPRWLALSMLGAASACLLAASPHFIFGPGDLASSVTQNNLTIANSEC